MNKFKIGDIVKCKRSDGYYVVGDNYKVTALESIKRYDGEITHRIYTECLKTKETNGWCEEHFELVKTKQQRHLPAFMLNKGE